MAPHQAGPGAGHVRSTGLLGRSTLQPETKRRFHGVF